MGRNYLETGSSKNPWLAGHSNLSLVEETEMVLGMDLGWKPPMEESILLPSQERLGWELHISPAHQHMCCQDVRKAPTPAPRPAFLKTGSSGSNSAGSQHVLYGGTYQSQKHLRNES